MFQVQLTRTKNRVSFYEASKAVDEKVNVAVHQLWGDYLDVHSNSDVALRYFHLVRDMFYTRISFENLNYEFLHNLAAEAKQLVNQLGSTSLRLIRTNSAKFEGRSQCISLLGENV